MNELADKIYSNLGTRTVFNKTLRHLVSVAGLIEELEKGQNLATQINQMVENGVLQRNQIAPIVSVTLKDRMNLPFRSLNLKKSVSNFDALIMSFQRWTNLNLVIVYHHPSMGTLLINPADPDDWESAIELKKEELIVVFAHVKDGKNELAEKALDAFIQLLEGQSPTEDPGFISKEPEKPKPVDQPAAAQQAAEPQGKPAAQAPRKPTGKRNLTPKYSVQVTNELFHNGNVEAWKNIIESYHASHQGSKVIVYHEGELIQDLNSLFKWGKVKHGGLIMFQVAGQNIKNVSRLQKYLHEGASSRFEAFMKQDINRVLNLF